MVAMGQKWCTFTMVAMGSQNRLTFLRGTTMAQQNSKTNKPVQVVQVASKATIGATGQVVPANVTKAGLLAYASKPTTTATKNSGVQVHVAKAGTMVGVALLALHGATKRHLGAACYQVAATFAKQQVTQPTANQVRALAARLFVLAGAAYCTKTGKPLVGEVRGSAGATGYIQASPLQTAKGATWWGTAMQSCSQYTRHVSTLLTHFGKGATTFASVNANIGVNLPKG